MGVSRQVKQYIFQRVNPEHFSRVIRRGELRRDGTLTLSVVSVACLVSRPDTIPHRANPEHCSRVIRSHLGGANGVPRDEAIVHGKELA